MKGRLIETLDDFVEMKKNILVYTIGTRGGLILKGSLRNDGDFYTLTQTALSKGAIPMDEIRLLKSAIDWWAEGA
jgi:hypothetical protein